MDSTIKIIQTLYLPGNGADPLKNSLGFLSPEFNWMGWALSCLQLKQYYPQVELYTNSAGYDVLINRLKLPYDAVHLVLNDLDFPAHLWAYPKLYTYSLQNGPFLHVDGDAFFWEKLDDTTLQRPLIAQNMETNDSYYQSILKHLLNLGLVFPAAITDSLNNGKKLAAYNAGIIGGNDIDFFKKYAEEAFGFVTANYEKLQLLKIPEINMIYEQVLFHCLAEQNKIAVTCYLPDEVTDMTYPGFADFMNVAGDIKYIHLMGEFKRNVDCCFMLASRLRHDYPGYYYRVIDECKKAGFTLYLTCYNNEINGNSAAWLRLYEHEKKQYANVEYLFRNNRLQYAKFKRNKFLKIANSDSGIVSYHVPLSYRMEFKQVEADQLDGILIDLMRIGRTFAELLNFITECFDEGDTTQGRADISKLLSLKLRAGLYGNLYEVCL
ncbi:DUF6734 family protein [Mucilaginibacter xinganensis]|uniref:DUF6734 domain-containing protein n=1 Tax=Mucilaginibacter xinganensis TaxID=1234841 RepID=A0A223NUE7_9SPHI|nr:DUF6734 family protein [Mucilaginibacter xinganensis]ASU33380.1 hypothetical protein MuYL_1482 [Mucilaginibacter xinganensis]